MKLLTLLLILIILFVLFYVSKNKENFSGQQVGICYNSETGTWGNMLPEYPGKCLTDNQVKSIQDCDTACQKKKNSSKKVVLVQPDSTNCLPKDTDFQLECEKKHLGLKEVSQVDCEPNMRRGICALGYRNGVKIPNHSTPCARLGSDFNSMCQTEFGLNTSYEKISRLGCAKGFASAICSDRYTKGVLKAPNITECIPRNSNQIQTMNEQCSQFYGLGHSLNKIEQRDCPSGYDRGICKFTLL